MKYCPYCNGEVSETAKKCKHCGEFLNNKDNTNDDVNYKPSTKTRNGLIISLLVIVAVMVVIVFFILFGKITSFEKDFLETSASLNEKYLSLDEKYSSLADEQWSVYQVTYGGGSDTSNNLKWIGERSLGFPEHLKGKECYILGSKISGDDGGTVRGFLGRNDNGSSYSFATDYEARINNSEEKIEITKWNGKENMLTKSERDNLYFSLTLLCRTDRIKKLFRESDNEEN